MLRRRVDEPGVPSAIGRSSAREQHPELTAYADGAQVACQTAPCASIVNSLGNSGRNGPLYNGFRWEVLLGSLADLFRQPKLFIR